jgi:hypothetical protein
MIRIIQNQEEEIKDIQVSEYEKEVLLAKYNFRPTPIQPSDNLSFEEMLQIEENKKLELKRKQNGPQPITFGGEFNSNTKYDTDNDLGFSYKINIVSNMKLD